MRNFVITILLSLFTSMSLFGQEKKVALDNIHVLSSDFCELCKERLTAKLIYSPGIIRLDIDEHQRELVVGFRKEQSSSAKIVKIIEGAGYDVEIIEQGKERLKLSVDVCHHGKAPLAKNE